MQTAIFVVATARSVGPLPGITGLRRPKVGQQSQGVDLAQLCGSVFHAAERCTKPKGITRRKKPDEAFYLQGRQTCVGAMESVSCGKRPLRLTYPRSICPVAGAKSHRLCMVMPPKIYFRVQPGTESPPLTALRSCGFADLPLLKRLRILYGGSWFRRALDLRR